MIPNNCTVLLVRRRVVPSCQSGTLGWGTVPNSRGGQGQTAARDAGDRAEPTERLPGGVAAGFDSIVPDLEFVLIHRAGSIPVHRLRPGSGHVERFTEGLGYRTRPNSG